MNGSKQRQRESNKMQKISGNSIHRTLSPKLCLTHHKRSPKTTEETSARKEMKKSGKHSQKQLNLFFLNGSKTDLYFIT